MGIRDGILVGGSEGKPVGRVEGDILGSCVGCALVVGCIVGLNVGDPVRNICVDFGWSPTVSPIMRPTRSNTTDRKRHCFLLRRWSSTFGSSSNITSASASTISLKTRSHASCASLS